jgi:addiction module RelE/StbE family toxin
VRLVWTERAVQDIESIEMYIARDNPIAAIELVEKIIEKAESLLDHPNRGRVVPEVANPKIRELILNNYRLVYRVRKKTIEVLQVFEGHRLFRTDNEEC